MVNNDRSIRYDTIHELHVCETRWQLSNINSRLISLSEMRNNARDYFRSWISSIDNAIVYAKHMRGETSRWTFVSSFGTRRFRTKMSDNVTSTLIRTNIAIKIWYMPLNNAINQITSIRIGNAAYNRNTLMCYTYFIHQLISCTLRDEIYVYHRNVQFLLFIYLTFVAYRQLIAFTIYAK